MNDGILLGEHLAHGSCNFTTGRGGVFPRVGVRRVERSVHGLVTAVSEVAEPRENECPAAKGCDVVVFFNPGHIFVGDLFEFWEVLLLDEKKEIGTEIDNEFFATGHLVENLDRFDRLVLG